MKTKVPAVLIMQVIHFNIWRTSLTDEVTYILVGWGFWYFKTQVLRPSYIADFMVAEHNSSAMIWHAYSVEIDLLQNCTSKLSRSMKHCELNILRQSICSLWKNSCYLHSLKVCAWKYTACSTETLLIAL